MTEPPSLPVADVTAQLMAARLRDWAIGRALPLWADRGVDRRYGGFHDRLCPVTLCNTGGQKRLRVTARQIYVFAFGEHLGLAGAEALVDHGLDFLLQRCANRDGSFTSSLTLEGQPQPGPIDLYDNAFALFALAKAYRQRPDSALQDVAAAGLAFILDSLAHPDGGFAESAPPALPRRQNPHMHLLEAALAWLDVRPDWEPFATLAQQLVDLFHARLLSPFSGLVAEFFDEDWTPCEISAEPGHHFEWLWLLHEARRHGIARAEAPESLRALSLQYGLNSQTGLLFGAIGADYRPTGTQVRLWPHSEWLRAEAVLGPLGDPVRAATALGRFLDHPVPGLWFETYDHYSGFEDGDAPASSLYHIIGGIEALMTAQSMDAPA